MKLKFSFRLIAIAALCVAFAAPLAAAAGIGTLSASGILFGAVALASASSATPGITLQGWDVSALNSAYGTKYADGSKSLRDLYDTIYGAAKFDSLFQLEYTTLSVYERAGVGMSSVAQAFQSGFTPKGTLTGVTSSSTLQRVKIDWKGGTYELWGSWLGFLRKEGLDEANQTMFLDFVINHLVKKYQEEMDLSAAYKGVYNAPTPGTAGNVGDSIDGVRKKINDFVSAGKITPISTGALQSDPVDFVTQVEAFVEGIPSKDRSSTMTLAMASEQYAKWRRGMRTKYNGQHLMVTELDQVIDHPNITVAGFDAMSSSSKIFCTPVGNAKKVVNTTDEGGQRSHFHFEQEDRSAKIWYDSAIAYHFDDLSRVYVNDQTT